MSSRTSDKELIHVYIMHMYMYITHTRTMTEHSFAESCPMLSNAMIDDLYFVAFTQPLPFKGEKLHVDILEIYTSKYF